MKYIHMYAGMNSVDIMNSGSLAENAENDVIKDVVGKTARMVF